MEVLDKIIELLQEIAPVLQEIPPVLAAIGLSVGSVWGWLSRRKKAAAATGDQVAAAVVQGTPVPISSSDEFELITLRMLKDQLSDMKAERDAAIRDRDAAIARLHSSGITYP